MQRLNDLYDWLEIHHEKPIIVDERHILIEPRWRRPMTARRRRLIVTRWPGSHMLLTDVSTRLLPWTRLHQGRRHLIPPAQWCWDMSNGIPTVDAKEFLHLGEAFCDTAWRIAHVLACGDTIAAGMEAAGYPADLVMSFGQPRARTTQAWWWQVWFFIQKMLYAPRASYRVRA